MENISQKSRVVQLDILRAIALFLVLGRHLPAFPEAAPHSWIFGALRLWRRCGWMGVDLFFVLSGFLVSGLLFSEYKKLGRIRLGRFFFRRGMKIYPAYYILLIFSVLVVSPGIQKHLVLVQALFLENYFMGVANIWQHTWSLAIEEHFYLLIGVLLALLVSVKKEDPFKALVPALVLCGVLCLSLRLFTPVSANHLFYTHFRLDSLAFGVLLSYFHHFERSRIEAYVLSRRWFILLLSALFIAPVLLLDLSVSPFLYTVELTLLYLAFGGLMMLFIYSKPIHFYASEILARMLSFFGFYSYSIYLWHLPLRVVGMEMLRRMTGREMTFAQETLFYLMGSLLAGVLMAKLIEIPFLRLRDRIAPG